MAGSTRTELIVPAAGHSQRFRDAGYTCPKPLLRVKWQGRTKRMIDWAIDQFYDVGVSDIHVGLPSCLSMFDGQFRGVPIERTMGQADTIMQMIEHCDPYSKIIVADCDVLIDSGILKAISDSRNADLIMTVVKSSDPNMSRIDSITSPRRVVEKQPLSEWGIVGTRIFANAEMIRDACHTALQDSPAAYLSDVVNALGDEQRHWQAVDVGRYVDWGTPEALEQSGARIVL